MKAIDWIEKVREANDNCSYYRAAQILGVTRAAISNAKSGRTNALDTSTARRVEIVLGLPEGSVIADQQAEQAPNDEMRAVWRRLGKLAIGAAHAGVVGVVLTICLSGISGKAEANQSVEPISESTGIYIMRNLFRRARRLLAMLSIPQYRKLSYGF